MSVKATSVSMLSWLPGPLWLAVKVADGGKESVGEACEICCRVLAYWVVQARGARIGVGVAVEGVRRRERVRGRRARESIFFLRRGGFEKGVFFEKGVLWWEVGLVD